MSRGTHILAESFLPSTVPGARSVRDGCAAAQEVNLAPRHPAHTGCGTSSKK